MIRFLQTGISVSALKERLKTAPSGAFVFYGEEELLKRFYLSKFRDAVKKGGFEEFNYTKLDFANGCTTGDLEDEVSVLPTMGDLRVVVVSGLLPQKLSEKDAERLSDICKKVPDGTSLIIYLEEEEFPLDKTLFKKKSVSRLAENAAFVYFGVRDRKTLTAWAEKILSADGVSASPETLGVLFDLCKSRMMRIKNELSKLSMYAAANKRSVITAEDVYTFVDADPEYAVYQLTAAVTAGNADAAEKMLDALKKDGTEPVIILGAMARHLTNSLVVLNGASPEDALSATGMQSWQFENLRRDLYGKKRENFEKGLSLCLAADKRVKSSTPDAFSVCERLCLELCPLLK